MKKILQVNFTIKARTPELLQAFQKHAPRFGPNGDVKGLNWKIWLFNESDNSSGGIYLFEDQASVDAYLDGDIVRMIKNSPALSNIEMKVFDFIPELTKISRGPVD